METQTPRPDPTVAHPRPAWLLSPRAWGLLLMAGSVAAFTAHTLALRQLVALGFDNAWVASTIRFAVGLAVVGILCPGVRWDRLIGQRLLVCRGLFGGCGVLLYYYTIGLLGAGRATFIQQAWVFFAAILAALILRETITRRQLAGCCAGLLGVGLMTDPNAWTLGLSHGDVAAVVGALLSAVVVIMIRHLALTETPQLIFASQCAFGLVLCLPFAWSELAAPNSEQWLWLAGAGLFAAAGQLAMTAGYRHATVTEGGLALMLCPVAVSGAAAFLFAEPWTQTMMVGAVLICAGSVLPVVSVRERGLESPRC